MTSETWRVLETTRRQVVEHPHVITTFEESDGQMGPDEPGPARNKDSHSGVLHTRTARESVPLAPSATVVNPSALRCGSQTHTSVPVTLAHTPGHVKEL